MKFQKTFLTLLLGVFLASAALAQDVDLRPLTKKEKKEWKKKKKKMTVEDFRALSEENVSQKASELGRQQNPSFVGDPNKVLSKY